MHTCLVALRIVYPSCTPLFLLNLAECAQREALNARGEIRPWPPKNPTYWQLRYWTTELKNGKPVRKRREVKLAEISREYQTEKSVEPLAQEILLPYNLGTHRPESTDSLDMYLQVFLERGEGGRSGKLKASTLGAYSGRKLLARWCLDVP